MSKWYSLSRWENYCLLAIASVAFLTVVTLHKSAQAAALPTATRALIGVPRQDSPAWIAHHRATALDASQSRPDVILLGDSITQGWAFNSEAWRSVYPGVHVTNAGIASDRVEHILWRVEHGLFATARPKVVVLLAGINNLADTTPLSIAAGLGKVIDAIHLRSPQSRVLVLGLFPSGAGANHPRRARIVRVNHALATLADGQRVSFVDIGDKFLEADGTLAATTAFDALHLTHKGYQIWSVAMAAPLHQLLTAKKSEQHGI